MQKNKHPELSIIIVNYNVEKLLRACLASIFADPHSPNWEVIVVDNASTTPPKALKKNFPGIELILNRTNLGFARANNLGAKSALSNLLLFLNPDTKVLPGSIDQLVTFAHNRKHLGAAVPKLLNPDSSPQNSCYHLPSISGAVEEFVLGHGGAYLKYAPQSRSPIKIDSAVGACILIPRQTFEKLGGWDERYFMYFEDIELARQIKKAHLDFWYVPQSEVIHIHGASSSSSPNPGGQLKASSITYFGLLRYSIITIIIYLSQKLKR